jgi:hypothetical protein
MAQEEFLALDKVECSLVESSNAPGVKSADKKLMQQKEVYYINESGFLAYLVILYKL